MLVYEAKLSAKMLRCLVLGLLITASHCILSEGDLSSYPILGPHSRAEYMKYGWYLHLSFD